MIEVNMGFFMIDFLNVDVILVVSKIYLGICGVN